jgi:hypothetical protein
VWKFCIQATLNVLYVKDILITQSESLGNWKNTNLNGSCSMFRHQVLWRDIPQSVVFNLNEVKAYLNITGSSFVVRKIERNPNLVTEVSRVRLKFK